MVAAIPARPTGTTLVQDMVPAARLNEGMTTVFTGLLIGISAEAAAGGWTVDRLGGAAVSYVYAAPAAAGLLALIAALAGRRRLHLG